jgi:predicted RND superfamily exporter protein
MKQSPLLGRWAGWAGANPVKVFLMALVITLILGIGAFQMEMEMTFFSIMPQQSTQVQDLKRITNEFPFASSLVVVVDGRGLPADTAKETVKSAIDEMASVFSSDEFDSALSGVYSKVDEAFLKEHGFLLSQSKDLKRLKGIYADPDLFPFLQALNDDLEREYSGDGEAMEDDEMQLVSWVGGVSEILNTMADALEGHLPDDSKIDEALDAYLLGESYYLSRSENMGVLFLNPRYTINDLDPLVNETNRIEERVKSIASDYGMTAGMTGLTVVGRDEMVTSEQGFAFSMLLAFGLILTLMIVVFRIRTTPLIIGVPLMLGVFWTMGLTGFILHRLNIMTAMYMVALVGLGVDYAIHLMTGFVQERDQGKDFLSSITDAFNKSGRGIVTGGFTTAAAFFALLMAESDMVRELAVVAGMGIFCELLAMLMLIPAFLGWRNLRLLRKGKADPMVSRKTPVPSDFVEGLGHSISKRPGLWILVLMTIGLALGTQAPRIELEDNLMKMEAEGLESVKLQDTMTEEFGAAPDVLYYLSEDPDELPALVKAIEKLGSVKSVDAITQWWPTEDQRSRRIPYLEDIRTTLEDWNTSESVDSEMILEELYRLEANLIEMGDLAFLGGTDRLTFVLNKATGLDKDGKKVRNSVFDRLFDSLESDSFNPGELIAFQGRFSLPLSQRIHTMAGTGAISLEDLPDMIRDTYLSKEGSSTLMTISPRMNPWVGESRNIFTSQVSTVTDRTTGMILAADQLILIAGKDGRKAVLAALIAVFLILLIDFKNFKLTALTFLPLLLSFSSLYGIMVLFNIKLDFVNIIAIPLLVGIGIDDAVHINHRYLLEGKGEMHQVLARTGSAVALTTITTIIGFASFIPSVMRAMRSTGIVLTLAMALAFLFSICLHPAVLVMVCEKWGWDLKPRTFKRISKEND